MVKITALARTRLLIQKRPSILLMSGGIDSVAAWVALNYPKTMHFAFNTPYARDEERVYWELVSRRKGAFPHINYTLQDLRPLGKGGKQEELPLRNLLMCNVAWAMGYDNIILAQATEWAPDKRWLFARAAEQTARLSLGARRKLRVLRPFATWSKSRLISYAIQRGGDWWLKHTYSCYTGGSPCGTCHPCHRAAVAFAALGITPPYDHWNIPVVEAHNWVTFLEWFSSSEGPQWWAPGSIFYVPQRVSELWRAYRNVHAQWRLWWDDRDPQLKA